jgi:hypothetical protein
MNKGRFALAALGVWIIRVALNGTFYGKIMSGQYEQIASAHPGILREVIPAYVVADLIFALVFACLFTKVGAAMGGGWKGGVKLGVAVAILSPVIGLIYQFYSVTYMPANLAITDAVFQLVAHAIQGVVAGLIYKS